MLKRRFVLLVCLITVLSIVTFANAFTTSVIEQNSTKAKVTISQTYDLYAYEINFDYTGSILGVQQYNFLGPTAGSVATYGYNARSGILSVYGSRLNSERIGINGSGALFNVSHSGGIDLRYTLAIYANGTEEYIYYNNTCGDGVCADGETCSTCSEDCGACIDDPDGGSGGGGGGGSPKEFEILPNLLNVLVMQGKTTRESVSLKNLAGRTLEIKEVDLGILKNFVAAYSPQAPFYVPAGGSVDFTLDFFARKGDKPDVYTGEIKIKTPSSQGSLNVILEVEEENPLFDVVVSLPKNKYYPGETIMAAIDIQNFGVLQNIDTIVQYSIKDTQGNILVSEEGSYAIDNYKLHLVEKLKIPDDAEEGDYLFYAKVSYDDEISASGSSLFKVSSPTFSPLGNSSLFFLIFIPIAIISVIIVTVIIIVRVTKKQPDLQQVSEEPNKV
jgi:hypothetical protein